MIKKLFFIILLFQPCLIWTQKFQQKKRDSLFLEIESIEENTLATDSLKAFLYNKIARSFYNNKVDSSLKYLNLAIANSSNSNIYTQLSNFYTYKGNLNRANGNMNNALLMQDSALFFASKSKADDDFVNVIKYNKGVLYQDMYKVEEALNIFQEILSNSTGKTEKSKRIIVLSYNNMGLIERNVGNYEKSIQWYQKGEELCQEYKFYEYLWVFRNNLGLNFSTIQDRDKELEYYLKALETMEANNESIGIVQNNIANVYYHQERIDSAVHYYRLVLSGKNKTMLDSCVASIALGNIFIDQNRFDEAEALLKAGLSVANNTENVHQQILGNTYLGKLKFNEKELEDATKYLKEANIIGVNSRDVNFFNELEVTKYYMLLTQFELEERKDLVELFESYMDTKDSVYRQDLVETMEASYAKFKTRLKEDSIKLLQVNELALENEIIAKNNLNISLFVGIAGLTLLAFLLFYFIRKVRGKNQILIDRNNEIRHRIKNNLTLLSVFMKQEAKRTSSAEAKAAIYEAKNRLETISMIDRKLNNIKGQNIYLDKYLLELTEYIKATYISSDSNFTIHLDIDNFQIDAEYAAWIGLIVNEMITNSIKYAFKDTTSQEVGISFQKKGINKANMTYWDNGIGLPADLNIESSNSFGFRMIRSFTEQLNGTIKAKNKDGTSVLFTFRSI